MDELDTEIMYHQIIAIRDRQKEIDSRLDGLVELVMLSLDKSDQVEDIYSDIKERMRKTEDKVQNSVNFFKGRGVWK